MTALEDRPLRGASGEGAAFVGGAPRDAAPVVRFALVDGTNASETLARLQAALAEGRPVAVAFLETSAVAGGRGDGPALESGGLLDAAAAEQVTTALVRTWASEVARRAESSEVERRVDEALRESEERYALAARGASDGLWDWDLRTGTVHYSERWATVIGAGAGELGTSPVEWFDRVHPSDVERVRAELDAHLRGQTPHFESEHRLLHRDGSWRWVLSRGIAARDDEGQAYRIAGSQTDISARKRAEEQLVHDALHDALTSLPNRVLFMDRLEQAIRRTARRHDYVYAVLFMDLDRFKNVNDSLGHLAGDELLRGISRRLLRAVRATDTVARLSGDEFAVLLEDIGEADVAALVAGRIQSDLRPAFDLGGHEVFASFSIGIALSTSGYERAEDVLRDADTAMYRAKSESRSRHVVFDRTMREQAVATLQLETSLRRAVDRGELRVVFQPILDVRTSRLAGFEALVRWAHPTRGTVTPAEFVPIAEETGLIVPIGAFVLREAAREVARWAPALPPECRPYVSVNVSARQLDRPEAVAEFDAILAETGLDPRRLWLEITESVLIGNAAAVSESLAHLRQRGIRIWLDDFGTGYSSLSYLQRFPIDGLKIDRSFVVGLSDGGEGEEVVRSILRLAKDLGLTVTAEGVETRAQLARLGKMGCPSAQGYLFAKPLDAERALEFAVESFAVPDAFSTQRLASVPNVR